MAFLREEVDGAVTTQKIRVETSCLSGYTSTAATLHLHTKSGGLEQKNTKRSEMFCSFCDSRGHCAQDCTKITELADRIERLKKANQCFLCLNCGHNGLNYGKKGKVKCAKCRKSHHITICDEGNKTNLPATKTNFTSVGGIEIT